MLQGMRDGCKPAHRRCTTRGGRRTHALLMLAPWNAACRRSSQSLQLRLSPTDTPRAASRRADTPGWFRCGLPRAGCGTPDARVLGVPVHALCARSQQQGHREPARRETPPAPAPPPLARPAPSPLRADNRPLPPSLCCIVHTCCAATSTQSQNGRRHLAAGRTPLAQLPPAHARRVGQRHRL